MFLLLFSGKGRPCNFFFKSQFASDGTELSPKCFTDKEHKGQTLIRIKKLTQNFRKNKLLLVNSEADKWGIIYW